MTLPPGYTACIYPEHGLHKIGYACPLCPPFNDHHSPLPNPEPKRDDAPALGGTVEGEEKGLARTVVRFVGHRVKPLDPDNFAGSCKALLDGLRHAHIIAGDEPWRIRLETEQVKVAHYSDEKTVITVTP